MNRKLTYFVSDVHLGLQVDDPSAREARFVDFLRSLPEETAALYLLGDVWDFWYEYRDVVPKGYVRVFGAIADLIDRGVDVYFFQGNHDVWTYSYFEELGMKRLEQPSLVEIGGRMFCLGHGDGLGPVPLGYRFLRGVFHSRVLQFLFRCCILGSRSVWATDGQRKTGSPVMKNMSSRVRRSLFISLLPNSRRVTRWTASSSVIIIAMSL